MRVSPAVALLVLIWLSGCVGVAQYQPYIKDIKDPVALAKDQGVCLGYAQAYKPVLSASAIATAGVQGGAGNLAGAAINPLVPVLGAVGGAGSELLSQIGILNNDQRRVFLLCLAHRGLRSGAYDVLDPNQ